jgi:lysophospholipase L1-like esterase
MPSADVRICFFGDSFTAGVGDASSRGWVGRVAERAAAIGCGFTAYNLGVRRETTAEIARRWRAEAGPRLQHGGSFGVVLATGVNDTAEENRHQRLSSTGTLEGLACIRAGAHDARWPLLVIAPALVADPAHNERIRALSQLMHQQCHAAGVDYIEVATRLEEDDQWLTEIEANDGAHPAERGYEQLTDIIWPGFRAWLDGVAQRPPV